MFDLCNITRALADESRIRILMALRHGPLCVCQITALLDLAPSTTSKHLSQLRLCRLIESYKQGRWVYYRLPVQAATPSLATALEWVRVSLAHDATVAIDDAHLEALHRAESNVPGPNSQDCWHSPALHTLSDCAATDEENE